MTLALEKDLPEDQSRLVAATIREEIARRRISRQRLADEARISISTLEKALSGRRPFTLATTIRLEEALGVALRRPSAPAPAAAPIGLAPADLGSYSRPAVKWIEGRYLTVRPSFGDRDAIYAYRTEISWERLLLPDLSGGGAGRPGLHAGRARVGAEPVGAHLSRHQQVRAVPAHHRLAADNQRRNARHPDDTARGARSAAHPDRDADCPRAVATVPGAEFGRIPPGHRWHERYRQVLRRTVEEPFAMFLPS